MGWGEWSGSRCALFYLPCSYYVYMAGWTSVTLVERTELFFCLKFDSCLAGYDFANITDTWGSHINERQGRTIQGMKSDSSLWIKPTNALNSKFVGITTLHISFGLSAHHQEFLAVHRQWYISCSFDDHLLPGTGWNCSFIHKEFVMMHGRMILKFR
jgi:hypothetical protein